MMGTMTLKYALLQTLNKWNAEWTKLETIYLSLE
jgi:hypothetical protein